MPQKPLTKKELRAAVSLVNKCVKAGYRLDGTPSATREAGRLAVKAGIVNSIGAFENRVRVAAQQDILPTPPTGKPAKIDGPAAIKEVEPAELIRARRLEDENRIIKARERDLLRTIAEKDDWRRNILGLMDPPLRPRLEIPTDDEMAGGRGRRAVLLHLTDIHYGENVDIDEMDGVNSFNIPICEARLGRFFRTSISLCTTHWTGTPPSEIILCLGGDLISGDIHAELTATNDKTVPETVRGIAEAIAAGIIALRKEVGVPIRIFIVPGNHGRLTFKPQSKHRAENSWDTLATDFTELMVRAEGFEDVKFYRTQSPDAYFSTFGFHWLMNHGDTMGSRGGQGFIGASATIMRGHRKLMDTSLRSGRMIHYLLTGHFHTTVRSPFGWAGGSVIGYNEYARDNRMDPEAAKQWMLVVHEQHGVISEQELYLGSPTEGSHYLGPASFVRPAFDD